jgi:predicted phage tail protein
MQLEMARKAGEDTIALDEKYAKDKKAILEAAAKNEEDILDAANKKEKDRKKALQSFNVGMAQQGLQVIADAAGEGTALAKAAAIAQATISGVQGVQNAFTSANANVALTATTVGAYPITMAALAGVFAAANIAKIASGTPASPSDAPPPPSTTTPAPQMMSGAFQLGGGVKPEPMKAFVVTDEMSNSQSQLANIRRRATI